MKSYAYFFKVVLIFCVCLQPVLVNAQSRLADSSALVALYNNTNGINWTVKTNWLSSQPINTWYGVTLTNNRLSALSLPANNLVGGPIPAGLATDSALATLNLSQNAITGTLPYFSDTSMVTLNLSNNQLTGGLNFYALKNLQTYNIANNQLSGGIGSLSSFPKLVTLNVSNNAFTGSLPYFSDTNMITLNLANNLLSGTINYYVLTNVQTLNFSNNALTGSTAPLGNFSKATTIDISFNQFSGTLPYLGNTYIQTFNGSHNAFTGTVPYYNAPSLVNLLVDHNLLSGALNFQVTTNLKVFTANSNKFSGAITPSLSGLTTLKLDSNKYTFAVVQPIATLTASPLTYGSQDTFLKLTYNTIIPNKLSVTAGGTLANNTYSWYKNGTLIATIAGDSTYTPSSNGSYSVLVTNSVATQLTLSSSTVNINTLLPIKLMSFTGQLTKKDNILSALLYWKTGSEANNDHFEIQRSIDGIKYDKVGSIASLGINGNSDKQHDYRFSDDISGQYNKVFYRLKQVDIGGDYAYSPVLIINISNQSSAGTAVSVYPNPAKGNISVKIAGAISGKMDLTLTDALGKTIFYQVIDVQAGDNLVPVVLDHYPAGTYTLSATSVNSKEVIIKTKLVKFE